MPDGGVAAAGETARTSADHATARGFLPEPGLRSAARASGTAWRGVEMGSRLPVERALRVAAAMEELETERARCAGVWWLA